MLVAKKPLVSIITPAYNVETFIAATIESVLAQTYPHWEMIIVDDASTDTTLAIVSEFCQKDSRIKVLQSLSNKGTGVARNRALDLAAGAFIAFLDADDLWKPEKLYKQLSFLEDNNLPFTFSFYEPITENGSPLNKRVEAPLRMSYRQLFFCNYVGNLTGIYSVAFFGKIKINETRKRQDWMQWLTVLKKIKNAKVVPESLAYYRVRENSLSASKLDLVKYNFRVYRNFHGYNFVKASVCMIGFLTVQLVIKPLYVKKIKAAM